MTHNSQIIVDVFKVNYSFTVGAVLLVGSLANAKMYRLMTVKKNERVLTAMGEKTKYIKRIHDFSSL